MKDTFFKIFVFLFFIGALGKISAQNADFKSDFSFPSTNTKADTSLDNIIYYYNSKTDYLIERTFDTHLDVFSTHYYNKANIPNDHYYLQLNNEGSATKDMIFHLDDMFSYKRNSNGFEPYNFTIDNVKYFQNRKAYTSLAYSNSINGNQFFNVEFAKNLYKGLNLQLNYFVNYADETFANSQVMNQFFNFSLNYITPSGRYRNNLAFAHNRAYIQENGGILNDSIFINQEYSKDGTYLVNNSSGWSKWKTSDYAFTQTFRIDKSDNNSPKIFNLGALVHSISYSRYAHLYDDRNKTIKDSLGTNIWRNSLFWTNNIYTNKGDFFIPLAIGINYDLLNFNDSLYSETFHLISPEIKFGLHYKNFRIDANLSTIVSDNEYKNDYQFAIVPKYFFFIGKSGGNHTNPQNNSFVFAEIKLQNKQPDYIFSHYLTENFAWDYDVQKTNSKCLSLGVALANKFIIKANVFELKNFYTINSDANIVSGDSYLYQLQLQNDFSIKSFRFKGVLTLQKADNEDILHLPLLTIKQGVAYSFSWIRGKLNTDVGLDFNYFTSYKADIYNPLLGIYCYQNSDKIGNYLFTDVYLNINIDRFCVFAMVQHPYSGLFNHNYFNSPLYPSQGFTFRYGVIWKLLD